MTSLTMGTSGEKSISPREIQAELALIDAARRDPGQFRVLYERYHERLYLFIWRRCSDENLCADLTQQVFLKALQKLDRYESRGLPFSAWLCRIALNEVNMYYRQSKRRRTIRLDQAQLPALVAETRQPFSAESTELIVKALQFLKPEEAELIRLRFFEEMPFREIGLIFGISENNAKVKLYRVLGKLKTWLTSWEDSK
ncbi:MAG: sigma-70 family RNA polymerase sigma factor [Bacteroidetes bacterium]|nr:MAG: sigma-70 family RNA polymerase sigma factor [Bacteroidota bacterium]